MCWYGAHETSGSDGWIPDLAPKYIPILPLDTNPFGDAGCYVYRSDGTDYKVIANGTMEGIDCSTISSSYAFYDPVRSSDGQCTVGLYTLGALDW